MGRPPLYNPTVEIFISGCGLSRQALIRLYIEVRAELMTRGDEIRRTNRHPDDPYRFFAYRYRIASGDYWHQFDFAVDDATADTHFFIEAVTYTSWRWDSPAP